MIIAWLAACSTGSVLVDDQVPVSEVPTGTNARCVLDEVGEVEPLHVASFDEYQVRRGNLVFGDDVRFLTDSYTSEGGLYSLDPVSGELTLLGDEAVAFASTDVWGDVEVSMDGDLLFDDGRIPVGDAGWWSYPELRLLHDEHHLVVASEDVLVVQPDGTYDRFERPGGWMDDWAVSDGLLWSIDRNGTVEMGDLAPVLRTRGPSGEVLQEVLLPIPHDDRGWNVTALYAANGEVSYVGGDGIRTTHALDGTVLYEEAAGTVPVNDMRYAQWWSASPLVHSPDGCHQVEMVDAGELVIRRRADRAIVGRLTPVEGDWTGVPLQIADAVWSPDGTQIAVRMEQRVVLYAL